MRAVELRELPLFAELSEDLFEIVAPMISEERYGQGEVIFEEGSHADKLYVIRDGEVEIRKAADTAESGHKLIAVLVKGGFFGEMALFLGRTRSAAAVAKTAVSLAVLDKGDFSALFGRSPDDAFKVMEFFASVLMDRLRNTTNELVAVYETGRVVASAHSMAELIDAVMERVTQLIECEGALFVHWNRFNMEYEVCGQKGLQPCLGRTISAEDPLTLLLAGNMEPFISFDLNNDARLRPEEGSVYDSGSLIASPLFSRDTLAGFIVMLDGRRPGAFSYEQMILLSAITGYVSVTLENLEYMQEAVDRSRLSQAKSSIPF